ncbi:MAG: hypothetical protein CMG50_04325 [Candidatus Marinimicrobia bacterium]|nr:hypothetical protein [Candidatus Neomarinimicrobiota bacterium]
MNIKIILITIVSFILVTSLFMYLMITNNIEIFITQFKWFMRAASPFVMIYLIYIGSKNEWK